MLLPDSSILTNIYVPGLARPGDRLFERKYITICAMGNRLYSDEELIRLPDISPGHPHFREWLTRKASMKRLTCWLAMKKRPLRILEIGCGNGWLSHRLADIPNTKVTGLDINFTELQQAARVFSDEMNLRFIHGDFRSGVLGNMEFDMIIFADSIQYFQSLKKILHISLCLLKPAGEVHILDSPFYRPAEIAGEKLRTAAYYASLGFPEMAEFHFHHDLACLRPFHHKILYNPNSITGRLLGNKGRLPWICVRNEF